MLKQLFLLSFILLVAYLLFWPVAVEPVAWNAATAPGYSGVFEQNNRLRHIETLAIDGTHGPEALALGSDNKIYATSHEGWIIRLDQTSDTVERWVNTGGRPLGIVFDLNGNLLVADAYKGLLSINPEGQITVLTNAINGEAIHFADDLDVADDGKIYFSDASSKFGAEAFGGTYQASLLDVMEHGGHGRLLMYNPADQSTHVVLDGLNFANGVALDPAGQFVLVNETSNYRVLKHWLAGTNKGKTEVLVKNLPGLPDNIVRGREGRFWIGLVTPRITILDKLSDKPWLRKLVQRLPSSFRPKTTAYGHVFAINAQGKVLISLQDPAGRYHTNTGALETDDYLYISSLHEDELGRIPINTVIPKE